MPIKIPLKPETEKAKDSLDSWRKDLEKTFAVKIPLKSDDVAFIKGLDRAKVGAGLVTGALEKGAGILSKYPEIFGETGKGAEEVVKQLKTGAETTLSWATTGATLGSIFPGIGTAVGGIVGGLAGAASATYDWWRGTQDVADETEKISKLRKIEEDRLKDENRKQKEAYDRVKKQWDEEREANDLSKQFASEFSAGIQKIAEDSEDTNKSWQGISKSTKEATETVSEWLDRTYDQAIRARSEIEALNKSVLDLLSNESARLGKIAGREGAPRDVEGAGNRGIGRDSLGDRPEDPMSDFNRKQADVATQERERVLNERVAQYERYASLVTSITGELTDQLEENIAAGNALFTGFGLAAERGVAQVLKALAKEYSVKAIGEFAEGLALVTQNPGAAANHFASAAKFGAAATAAAIGGAVVGGDASRRERAEEGAGGGGGGASSTQNRFSDPGTQQLSTVVYMGGGPGSTTIYAGESEREKQNARKKLTEILTVGKPK